MENVHDLTQHYTLFDKHNIGSFQKKSTLPQKEEISAVRRGGEKKVFLIKVNVLGHPNGIGGLTSNFLRGEGMDVFWNDPLNFN